MSLVKINVIKTSYFSVEYYSSDLQSGWVVAAHRVPNETCTLHNLRPDTRYMFLVRAENSYGLGAPSEMSDVVHTSGNFFIYENLYYNVYLEIYYRLNTLSGNYIINLWYGG